MRFAKVGSWQITINADVTMPVFALWLRDVEAIDVPRSPLVPGPLDMGDLPPPLGAAQDPRLGEEWLAWWISLVDRRPRPPLIPPDDDVEPAHDTPDPLGLARLPALRGPVTRRWTEFLHWRTAHQRTHGTFADRRPVGDLGETNTVGEVEATLGRKAAPFSLTFTLLPVRDDRIRQVETAHYLVPERVYLGDGWPTWLRAVVAEVA
ncbi:hypothetical protein [Virgisporangium aurantiacum]|uniref:Uncharacterized protein n=1 Tax=Virgisporangium aurantiacum TaxID=175570 RepID=A0A8J3Z6F1_9ACTN|nr:hypothetical protein [Virgisporangium aurantiacum]GIJ57262.1 hypothetical protein Vau01_047780 [Virgisporangium aurantiacum]